MNTPRRFPPQVMGILNITPDSFYAGSRVSVDNVLQRAEQMVQEGASIIDIGGESTRPGARLISEQEEQDRVLPVIELLANNLSCQISVDTQKAGVMSAAIKLGARFINDVNALQAPGALTAVAASSVDVCLMHRQGSPETMQEAPHYRDVMATVHDFFTSRLKECELAGIARGRIILDPGIGFGKLLAHNLRLIKQLQEFKTFQCRLLVGVSRKSMIGQILNNEPEDRLIGSVSLATIAYLHGADIIRTHDVKATNEALTVAAAVAQEGGL